MKIDEKVNVLLRKVFGTVGNEGDGRVYFHSQNLNEDRRGDVKGWPYHGRCWLWLLDKTGRHLLDVGFSWNLWSRFCGMSVSTANNPEHTLNFHVAFPPVSLWLSFENNGLLQRLAHRLSPGEKYTFEEKRELSWTIHDNHLFWKLWMNPDSWKSSDPKWRYGNVDFRKLIFGDVKITEKNVVTKKIGIPMPEGVYPADLKLFDKVVTDRFTTTVIPSAHVDIDIGIPHNGKGENSWDCGEDALYGSYFQARTTSEAIARVVQSALRYRERYNGNVAAVYPHPDKRRKKIEAERKRAAKASKPESQKA